MTEFDSLMSAILGVLPNASFGEDNEGQVVIYSDVMVGTDERLIPFDPEG